jgi:small conductance mechanosensitive channel
MTDQVFRWTEFALGHGTRLLTILLISLILVRVLRMLTRRLIASAGSESAARVARMREQHTRTLAGILYSGGTAVIIIVAALMALPEFGFNITPVAAAAGLASLSIGFGAQHVVHDFINGFFTVLEDQYVVGDIVRIGDVVGRVEHLTLRRTVVRDPQGAVVTIPNSEISKVANLSRDWGQLFLDAIVAADQPLDEALNALEAVASEFRADPSWSPMLLDGPRVLGVESLAPNGTTVRLQVRTAPTRQDDVARELRRRIQIELAGFVLVPFQLV